MKIVRNIESTQGKKKKEKESTWISMKIPDTGRRNKEPMDQ